MLRAVDLFSGVGGMSLGFKRVGVSVAMAIDADKKHATTYARNFPSTLVLNEDIHNVSATSIYDSIGHHNNIDLIFGGPPCQGFSVMGNQSLDDKRNSLIYEFARLVKEIHPRAFVIENVAGLLSHKFSSILATFYAEMKAIGYQFHETPYILNARDYCVPQSRARVFIIGVAKPHALPSLPRPIFEDAVIELRRPCVSTAISDLPLIESLDYLLTTDRYYGSLGQPSLYAQKLREDLSLDKLFEEGIGGFKRTIHSDKVKKRFTSTMPGDREPVSRFQKLDYNGIAPTLLAGTTKALGQFMAPRPIHPIEPRCITIREAARLHSFPDWFEFYPTKWYGYMQIGNSVPPFLAEAVANAVIDVL